MKLLSLLPILVLLLCSQVGAESASVTLQSLDSLSRAHRNNEQLCENIRREPGCVENLQLMQSVLGLSVIGCRNMQRELQCAQVVRNFPGFTDHGMSCTPYDVCRTGLTSTLVRGCGRYGIQVRNEFAGFLRQMGECLHDWSCMGNAFLRSVTTVLFPGQAAVRMGQAMAQEIREDFEKARYLQCFDPETQGQFACYLTVKYGLAATGVAGLARTGAAAMVGRMASLERRLLRFRNGRPSARTIVRSYSTDLAASGNVRILRRTNPRNPGRELNFAGDTLRPGQSYTVLVRDGKVVFGQGYRNADGSYAMTHLDMLEDLGSSRRSPYTGGSVRINRDGSIDVSGYSRQTANPRSANAIADILRETIPDARINVYEGRLP